MNYYRAIHSKGIWHTVLNQTLEIALLF